MKKKGKFAANCLLNLDSLICAFAFLKQQCFMFL